MILLTGATGNVGSALLRRLTAQGERVRCLVRDPRRLGPERVRVQISLGDLQEPGSFRHAMRGVKTVVHLHAPTRFSRAKALAERAVADSSVPSTVFAPSIVYSPDNYWVRLMERLTLLPAIPISGTGDAKYQPIW